MNKVENIMKKPLEAFSSKDKKLETEFKNETKLKILSLVQSSSIHGYPKLFDNKSSFFKAMWGVCFLAAVGGCGYLVSQAITSFLDNEVVTKYDVIYQVPMQFPTVTICYLNPFLSEKSDKILFELFSKLKMSLGGNVQLNRATLLNMKYLSTVLAHAMLTDDEKKNLSYGLEDTLIGCTFGMIDCFASEFEWYFEVMYGNCYKFNSGKNSSNDSVEIRDTIKAGTHYGFNMDLYLPESKSNFNFETNDGLHIFIGNATVIPYIMGGITAAPGFQTSIAVSRAISSKVPYPFSKCKNDIDNLKNFDNALYQETIRTKRVYSQIDCFDLCAQRKIINECNCHITFLGSLNSNIPCLNMSQIQCSFNIYTAFFKQNVEEKCPDCPLECESEAFTFSTTFSKFPSKNYADIILSLNKSILNEFKSKNYSSGVKYDKIRDNLVSLSVYFERLEYTQINQTKKTELIDLVSGIGGTMGLFVGVSFLSFVEFIEIILYAIYRGFFAAMRKKFRL